MMMLCITMMTGSKFLMTIYVDKPMDVAFVS